MPNILPKDENVWLLIAESVQVSADGKMSLLGFFGAEHIQIPAAAPLPASLDLTFVFLLREGAGSFSATFQIRDPHGGVVHTEELDTAQKPSARENHGIAVTMAPFIASSFGAYRLTLTLDGKRYKRSFTVEPESQFTGGSNAH